MYPILEAKKLADKIYLMVVKAPRISANCKPGEFVIVKMDEKGERIPLTICDYDREKETISNADIVFLTLVVDKILDDLGNHSLVSVRAVICCHIEISGNSLHLLLKDQQILCLGSHDDINIDPMFL